MRVRKTSFSLLLLAASGLVLAQNEPPANTPGNQQPGTETRGWRRATPQDQAPPAVEEQAPPAADATPAPQTAGPVRGRGPLDAYGQPQYGQDAPPPQQDSRMMPPPAPDRLTIRPGMYLTVRMNQALSSDHNQPGDAFTATLVKPLVVDGVVVAHRGQTIAGHVTEAQKAGRVSGVSRLGVQLTEISLADGQQLPVQTQLITHVGDTAHGRDAVGIAATTATGAAIGGIVDGGFGAGIGAAAGAVAGVVGVLLTRGYPTYITPESVLTFRIEAPVTVDTSRAPMAFRYVEPSDYSEAEMASRQPMPPPRMAAPPPYYYAPPAYYAPAYYGPYAPYYYPPYGGPSVGVYFAPGFFYYGGHGYYHGYYHHH